MTLWPKGINLVKNLQSSFFKQRKMINAFQHLANTYSKGPSAVFGASWRSYRPRTWHYSGQLEKKRRKTKTICYFIRKRRENPQWFANSYKSHNKKLERNLVLMLRALEGELLFCSFSVKETVLCALGQWGQFSFPSGKGYSRRACWPTMHALLGPQREKEAKHCFSS